MKDFTILGMDPGARGAAVILTHLGTLEGVLTFPSNLDDIDMRAKLVKDLKAFITKHKPRNAYLEDVHAIFGASAKSTWNFARNATLLEAVCHLTNTPLQLIAPKAWQAYVWEDVDAVFTNKEKERKVAVSRKDKEYDKEVGGRQYKKALVKILDTKKTSLNAAIRLVPEATEWRGSTRQKIAHDGVVDAALIAYTGVLIENCLD